jgi:hypothetical protein
MATHAKISDIVEEDYCRCARGIGRFGEESSDNHFRSPWFTDHTPPEVIEFSSKLSDTAWKISCSKIGATRNDNTCWLSLGVGIDYINPVLHRPIVND